MTTLFIQNHMQRPFVLNANPKNKEHTPVHLLPGESEAIEKEHWDEVRKGNEVLAALLDGQHLTVSDVKPKTIKEKALENPDSPKPPEMLTQETKENPKLQRKKATEVKELDTSGAEDGPAAAQGRRGR